MIHKRNELSMLEVPIQRIQLGHDQPRRILDREAINRMKLSLSITGQLQPIGVRRYGNGWILIFGYLRLRAAQQLGWKTIRAVEYPETENQKLVDLTLWASQNLHHVTPALDDMACAVSRLADAGMAVPVVAVVLGRSVDWVNGMLEIARNPMARRLIDTGRLVEAEAWSAFMRLSPGVRKKLLDGTEPITRQSCEQAQRSADQDQQKKKQPVLQKSFQVSLQSDSTLDLFSPAVMDDGNSSTANIRGQHSIFLMKAPTDSREAPL